MTAAGTAILDLGDYQAVQLDVVRDALENADARGMTPSAVARSARIHLDDTRGYLRLIAAAGYAHTTGNGSRTRYYPGGSPTKTLLAAGGAS